MRVWFGLVAVCVGLALSSTSNAAMLSISTLRNTGWDSTGTGLLTQGQTETNYKLVSQPAASTADLIALTSAGGFPVGPWIADNTTSRWIRPDNGVASDGRDTDPAGDYVYETEFSMAGLLTSSAVITGRWATDNSGSKIVLNGVDVTPASTSLSFTEWTSFAIDGAANNFLQGINKLKFYVNNASGATGNPTGLRVEMSGSALAVPLPATAILLLTGLPGIGIVLRRSRKMTK